MIVNDLVEKIEDWLLNNYVVFKIFIVNGDVEEVKVWFEGYILDKLEKGYFIDFVCLSGNSEIEEVIKLIFES